MKLIRVQIKKFRSIEKCDIRINKISALVGENNVGKSTLLRALNAFFNLEEEKPFFIDSSHQFSPRSQPKIILTLSNLPDDSEITEKSHNNKLILELKYIPRSKNFTLSYQNSKAHNIGLEFIDKIKKYIDYIFIPPTRSEDELKWQEAKAIKRVISALLENKFRTRDTVTPKFKEAAKYLQNNALNKINKQLADYYGDRSGFNFNLRFKENISFLNFLTELDFTVNENGCIHNISDCGTGVQSLSIIALYRMFASIRDSNIIIGIEEPETNLHPQSQKQLAKRILSPNNESVESQVLFTTHSTVIIDSLEHLDIILFRKEQDSTRGFKTVVSQVRDDFWQHYDIEELKYYKFHKYRNSDFFFSRLIIVVESSTDAEIIKQLLLQKKVDLDDYPVSVLNLDGIKNLKYPLYLIKELDIPYILIVDKDFFVPYTNGSLKKSRYNNGFPKYASCFAANKLIEYLIPKENHRENLLSFLRNNHSKALDLLEEYNIICMKYNLETDLVTSNTASKLFYDKLSIPEDSRNRSELLINKSEQIKTLNNLVHVIKNTPHKNLPNSYKRIKKMLERLVKKTVE